MKIDRVYWIIVISLLSMVALFAASIDDLTVYTEEYPPYNFEENGQLKGISIEIFDAILKETNSKKTLADVKLVPWARSYDAVQKEPMTLLFAMTRTKERESMFKWVGPIAPTRVSVLALTEKKIKINSPEDLQKYQIGVVRDDVAHQLLEKAGNKDNIQPIADNLVNIKKMQAGRIDLWGYAEFCALWQIKTSGNNPTDFEVVYVLDESSLEFAFHKDTPDEIVKAMQKALDKLIADGTHQKILDKYLK
ncbi:MAG: transporter substrate-binding domain-containing protein [Candidatus Cloacimonetes bacterium]|nr:transporter substrate-binding domain-containing protein [Candidatus Cloacimonadota bacterium]